LVKPGDPSSPSHIRQVACRAGLGQSFAEQSWQGMACCW
jgi:hypothetical protein